MWWKKHSSRQSDWRFYYFDKSFVSHHYVLDYFCIEQLEKKQGGVEDGGWKGEWRLRQAGCWNMS